jgi:hypothetical protein
MNQRDAVSREGAMPVDRFRSKEAYRKSRAYRHIHGIKSHAKGVVVAGKYHEVKHGKKKTRRKGSGKR